MPNDIYDVIVVGAGGSGLAAAYAAAQQGARVLVLEKQPQPGGTTGIAVGSFTAAGTSLQRRAGINDDATAHAADVAKFAAPELERRDNHELREFFLREAAASFEWLRDLGLSFVGPNPEPPNRCPRMHNVVPGAKAYIAALQLALSRTRSKLLCNVRVESLLRHGPRVIGVRAQLNQHVREFRAQRGVVLAAGDYAGNARLIAAHKGEPYQHIEGINPFATGDGHLLAQAAGAKLINMDVTYGPELRFVPTSRRPFQQWLPASGLWARIMAAIARHLPRRVIGVLIKRLLVTWQHPENKLFDDGAILVNRSGQRFCDERRWPDRELAVAGQLDKVAYMVLDQRLVELYSRWPNFISTAPNIAYAYVADYQRLRSDVTTTGRSLEEVAQRRGLDARSLAQTIQNFNAYVRKEVADPWGRSGDSELLQGSSWVLLGPLKAYFTTTEGGANVNPRMQVLDEHGVAIPGLYAVGQNGLGGMILWGHGLHIAWAITSGRIAGKAIMEGESSHHAPRDEPY